VELRAPAGDSAHFDLRPIEKSHSRLKQLEKLIKRKDRGAPDQRLLMRVARAS